MPLPLSASIWHDWESGARLSIAQPEPAPWRQSASPRREKEASDDEWDHLWTDLGGEG